MFYKVFCFYVVVLINIAVASSGPETCYFCRTYIEGEVCNDPLDTSAVSRQHCSNFSLVETALNKLGAGQAFQAGLIRTETPTACIKLTYLDSGVLTTIRGCEYSLIGDTEVCAYLDDFFELTNFTCQTCTTNLCNLASTLHISVFITACSVLMMLFY